jgi:glyoxylase-like metal-dependent hydrolase (beta-lactamase superfamily II)
MQGSTVVISPPDGDMAQYLASLERLRTWRPKLKAIAPGHGLRIDDPEAKLVEYIEHRLARERQIAETLRSTGPTTPEALVALIYTDVDEELHPVARKSVWAHLRKLRDDGLVESADPDDIDAIWSASG